MAQFYQGTIQTLSNLVNQQKAANLQRETPQYKLAMENLIQAKEAGLRQKQLLSQLETAPVENIPEILARSGQTGLLGHQIAREATQAERFRTTANQYAKGFENVTPEDVTYIRETGEPPIDAFTRKTPWQKRLVDPFVSSFQRGLGSKKAKAQTELAGVEAIKKDVSDVFSNFLKIPDLLKGPLAGRTVGKAAELGQPDVVTFKDTKELVLANIAKKLGGEVGVLTDRDIDRIKNALPGLSDTKESATRKMKYVMNYVDRRIKGFQKSAGLTPSGIQIEKTEWFDTKFNENKIPVIENGKQSVKQPTQTEVATPTDTSKDDSPDWMSDYEQWKLQQQGG